MNHILPPFEDHARQTARFRLFLRWVFVIVLPVALLELLGGLLLQVLQLGLVGALTLSLLGPAWWARRLVRRGALRPAALSMCAGVMVVLIGGAVLLPIALPALAVCVLLTVTLALPHLDRRPLAGLMIGAGGVGVLATVLARTPAIQQLFPPLPALIADGLILVAVAAALGLTLLLLWQFSSRLTETLTHTQVANAALRAAQTGLEAQVAARTADLQTALAEVQARAVEQARLLAKVEQQRTTIRELSVPVIPISATTLIMPLVGALDTERLRLLQTQALRSIEHSRARTLIMDITGVPLVDSQVAQGLLGVVQATRLLGAETVLVGIRPEVAQAIVGLGLDLHRLQTDRDLQLALGRLAARHANDQHP